MNCINTILAALALAGAAFVARSLERVQHARAHALMSRIGNEHRISVCIQRGPFLHRQRSQLRLRQAILRLGCLGHAVPSPLMVCP